MVERETAEFDIGRQAPDRGTSSALVLWFGGIGAALAWSVQILVGSGFSGSVCLTADNTAATTSSIPWGQAFVIAINIAALVVCLLSIGTAYVAFRRTRTQPGVEGGVNQAGEGRTRFLAIWGMWAGILFLIATAFNTIPIFWGGLCHF